MSEYPSIGGFIQFDPREREAGDKKVRDIVVKPTGLNAQNISVTLWPDFKDVAVKKGDLVFLEGKYSKSVKEDKTYHNISLQRIKVFSDVIEAPKPETTNTDAADDDAPF